MNALFMRYEISSGRGIDFIAIPDLAEWKNPYYDGTHALYRGSFNPSSHYIHDGSQVERPASAASCDRSEIEANGEDVAELTGLPVPCMAMVSGPTGVSELAVPDGALSFSASVPGAYRVQIEAFPVRDWEVYIHAV